MAKKLLYATTNPGKIFEVGKLLKLYGVKIISPKDLKINIDVPETGQTLRENARLKIEAYLKVVGADTLVMADDTGAEIDALGGEPGIHVRRWQDKKTAMTDKAIVDYAMTKLKGVPTEKRTAKMRTVIALATKGSGIEFFEGVLKGLILEAPRMEYMREGFPFGPIFYVPAWKKLLGEVHDMDTKKKDKYLTHREKATIAAVPRIKELLAL
ncbi:non-canonical purine NTP pyrophosphatase [Candidatus Woesebacteria bacterium]|nr:non-canonical purine NTP pyrophosphatase [Candidatus Woesebacteria bacterium]